MCSAIQHDTGTILLALQSVVLGHHSLISGCARDVGSSAVACIRPALLPVHLQRLLEALEAAAAAVAVVAVVAAVQVTAAAAMTASPTTCGHGR
jgi:hypothetical protein